LQVRHDQVKIHFESSRYNALPLYFWMFERTIDYLLKSNYEPVCIGAKLQPPYDDFSVEGQIWKDPYPTGTSYKATPHVCDILALAGYIEYIKVVNPKTRREVQGVRLLKKE
jgi:hypothetical protein